MKNAWSILCQEDAPLVFRLPGNLGTGFPGIRVMPYGPYMGNRNETFVRVSSKRNVSFPISILNGVFLPLSL